MNKKELIDVMQNELNKAVEGVKFTKTDADAVIRVFGTVITTAMANGNKVVIPSLGTFSVTERAARIARNPKTGEPLSVAAYKAPKFKASKAFKDLIRA